VLPYMPWNLQQTQSPEPPQPAQCFFNNPM
jgi:hypothetical protein